MGGRGIVLDVSIIGCKGIEAGESGEAGKGTVVIVVGEG